MRYPVGVWLLAGLTVGFVCAQPVRLASAGEMDSESFTRDGAAVTLPTWSGSFVSGGITYTYKMLGTDPSAGSATSRIQVVLIPLRVAFADGTVLDATAPAYAETRSALQLTQASPLFRPAIFAAGATKVGHTQYIDAFQRANFWNYVSTVAADYHLEFELSTLPVETLTVPAQSGSTVQGPGNRLGSVSFNWWDRQMRRLLQQLKIKPAALALFLSYNVLQYTTPTFAFGGYHGIGNQLQVYMSAGFFDQGVIPHGGDIEIVSHELGEATDDPYLTNIVPYWNNPQTPGACSNYLEVGDPVSDVPITPVVLNGYTYHPEDLTFLSWFSGAVPSTSVNGWYTFGNHYSGPATCTF